MNLRKVVGCTALATLAGAGSASAQTAAQPPERRRPEITLSVGRAGLWAWDFTQGDWPSLGGGVIVPLTSRLSAEVEVTRMLGTTLETITTVQRTCHRSGGVSVCGPEMPLVFESGTSSLMAASVGLRRSFGSGRVQPFVGAGLSFLAWDHARLCTLECPGGTTTYESETHGGGMIVAGARIAVGPRVSVSPELRTYITQHAVLTRGAVTVGFGW